MREDRIINVFYRDRLVGTLAMTNERKAAFLMNYTDLAEQVVEQDQRL